MRYGSVFLNWHSFHTLPLETMAGDLLGWLHYQLPLERDQSCYLGTALVVWSYVRPHQGSSHPPPVSAKKSACIKETTRGCNRWTVRPIYDAKFRGEIRKRMSPPSRETVTEISRATGISRQTLYSWRHLWKREGELVPASSSAAEEWEVIHNALGVAADGVAQALVCLVLLVVVVLQVP